jgi:hypothetical protein
MTFKNKIFAYNKEMLKGEIIGKGSSGEVIRALLPSGKTVAVKIIRDLSDSEFQDAMV